MDTGSPWPLSNNPAARHFKLRGNSTTIPCGEYPLWKVVRASTVARMSHPRYHVRFEDDSFRDHPGLGWKDADVSALAAMDKLHAVGVATGAKMIDAKHFPGGFRPLTTSAPT